MAITRIQTTNVNFAVAATSKGITLGASPGNGNFLVIARGGNGDTLTASGAITSISQTGATWVLAKKNAFDDTIRTSIAEIWYAENVSSASTSITVNMGLGGEGGALIVAEYSGVATSSSLDKTASNQAASGTVTDSGTTATTSQADEVWIAALANPQISPNSYSSPSNGFTIVGQNDVNFGMGALLEKIAISTGAANTSATQAAGFEWSGCIATFKAAASIATFNALLLAGD